jgi:hypothetical protein
MKFFVLLIVSIPLILWKQCSDDPDDCMCTEEFRMYFVVVVDTLGNPVDSLHTSIKNERGKEYNFGEFEPPPYSQGAYFVMTDGYEGDFRSGSNKIFFKGTKEDKQVTGEFEFKTDKCLCHVYKIAGPDTLVLK